MKKILIILLLPSFLSAQVIKQKQVLGLADSLRALNPDSVRFRNQLAYTTPTAIIAHGTSITFNNPGTQASDDSVYASRLRDYYPLPLIDNAVSGSAIYSSMSLAYANINAGHSYYEIFEAGFNSGRYFGASPKGMRQIVNAHYADWLNHFASSFTAAGSADASITTSGTWGGYSTNTVGGKFSNGLYTQTSGDYIEYTFIGTQIGVGMVAFDSTNLAGASFNAKIDGVTKITSSTNQQAGGIADGSYSNQRTQMAIVISGLTAGSHVLRITSTQSTNVLAIDYFAEIAPPGTYPPLVWVMPSYMDATGYAIAPANATDAVFDSIQSKVDSLAATLPVGYPLYVVHTNSYFVIASGLAGDHIHPNNTGQRQYFNGVLATVPTLPIHRDNTVLAYYNNLFMKNRRFAFIDEVPDVTASNFIQNQTSTVQTAAFKISGESYINNILHVGTGSYTIPLRVRVGSAQYTDFLGDGSGNIEENVNLARTDAYGKTLVASAFYAVNRASSVDTHMMDVEPTGTKIFGYLRTTGAIGIGGAVGGGGYAFDGVWPQYLAGEGYLDAVAAGGASFKNLYIRGLNILLQESGNTVASATSNGFNIFNAFRPNNAAGTSGDILKSQGAGTYPVWVAQSTLTVPLSGITAATAFNSINHGDNQQIWAWNALTGIGFNLSSTSTAAASNAQILFRAALSGTNATSAQTTYTAQIKNSHAGTTSTNVALYLDATNGTSNNYGLLVDHGSVGIGNTAPVSTLDVQGGSFGLSYVAKTGTYTATSTDHTIDCTSGTFTVTLPTAVGITGREYIITNSGAGVITIATTSAQTFTNVVTTPITLTLSSVGAYRIQSTGSNWIVW